ncbi:transglutaminase domain-containing protein [Candidatus Parcubacteria bacterium]|nr:transglutaminase domain-containing protein [Candidatus Parcubacteria bacterium]
MTNVIIFVCWAIVLLFGAKYLMDFVKSRIKKDKPEAAEAIGRVQGRMEKAGCKYAVDASRAVSKIAKDKLPKWAGDMIGDELELLIKNILPTESIKGEGFFRAGRIYTITDDPTQPFQITPQIAQKTDEICKQAQGETGIINALFNWFTKNIDYDKLKQANIKKGKKTSYQHSEETFARQLGVCGEMAILFIVMARHAGIKANYASISVDCDGKKVRHACASVLISGQLQLIDPAYKSKNAQHRQCEIFSDSRAIEHFKLMRNN